MATGPLRCAGESPPSTVHEAARSKAGFIPFAEDVVSAASLAPDEEMRGFPNPVELGKALEKKTVQRAQRCSLRQKSRRAFTAGELPVRGVKTNRNRHGVLFFRESAKLLRAPAVDIGFEHTHKGEVPVTLRKIQAVADDEVVRYGEAHVVSLHLLHAARLLVEQHAGLE